MLIEIQKTIPNVPYSVNKQSLEVQPDWTQERIKEELAKAKLLSDLIDAEWQKAAETDAQSLGENALLRKANDALDLASSRKSVLIDALKREIGDERYAAIRETVIDSVEYKALTLHANDDSQE